MMPKAQATGMLLPHSPIPVTTVAVTQTKSSTVPAAATAKAAHHSRERGCHTVDRSWSDSSVSVGFPTTRGSATAYPISGLGLLMRARYQFRGRVPSSWSTA
jgi:hypothetical protein